MAATLNSIVNKRAKLTIPLDKDDPEAGNVNLVFKPNALTPRKNQRYLQAVEKSKDRGQEETVKRFLDIVVEWDLRWDASDSEPIPLTVDALMDVPDNTLGSILAAIGKTQNPDPPTENA